jgi:hypothetical protein
MISARPRTMAVAGGKAEAPHTRKFAGFSLTRSAQALLLTRDPETIERLPPGDSLCPIPTSAALVGLDRPRSSDAALVVCVTFSKFDHGVRRTAGLRLHPLAAPFASCRSVLTLIVAPASPPLARAPPATPMPLHILRRYLVTHAGYGQVNFIVKDSNHIAPAAMLTVRASNVALKMNDTAPWAATRRRSALDVTATSETCDVMPTTKEK